MNLPVFLDTNARRMSTTEPQKTRKFILEEQKMCFLSWLFGGKGADEMTEEDELMLWMMLDEEEEDEK